MALGTLNIPDNNKIEEEIETLQDKINSKLSYIDPSVYDIQTKSVSSESISTLPYRFYGGSAVVYNNEIHILGGNATSYYTAHYKWNGSSWSSVSTLPYDFYGGSAVVYNNEIHILGGNATSYYTYHYKWNGSSWSKVSTLPYQFCWGTAVSIVVFHDKIHMLGSGVTNYRKYHYKWDGSNWSKVSTLPYPYYDASAVIYNNAIHMIGGSGSASYRTYHYQYNGLNWVNMGEMSHSFYYGSSVVHDNAIHVLGGESEKKSHHKMVPTIQYMCKIRVISTISIIGGDDLIIYNSDNIEQTSNELSVPGIYYIYTKEPFVIK